MICNSDEQKSTKYQLMMYEFLKPAHFTRMIAQFIHLQKNLHAFIFFHCSEFVLIHCNNMHDHSHFPNGS